MKWKTIAEFPAYQISEDGQCRRVTKKGHRYLKPIVDKDGYHRYCLSKESFRRHRRAHRLVYEAFVGEIPDGYHIDHKDFNRINNKVTNLEAVTRFENTKRCVDNRRYDDRAKPFTKDEVLLIRYHIEIAMNNCVQIAKMFDCEPSRIYDIKQGKTYSQVI